MFNNDSLDSAKLDAWITREPLEWHKGHSAACRRHNHRVEDPDCICGFQEQREAERDEDCGDERGE